GGRVERFAGTPVGGVEALAADQQAMRALRERASGIGEGVRQRGGGCHAPKSRPTLRSRPSRLRAHYAKRSSTPPTESSSRRTVSPGWATWGGARIPVMIR